jgi:hypothetical protein
MTASARAASVSAYLDELAQQRRLSAHTVNNYRHDLDLLCTLIGELPGDCGFAAIETHHIRRFVAQLHTRGLGGRSLGRTLSAWRGFYRWLGQHAHGHAQPGRQRAAAEEPEGAAESAVAGRSEPPAGSGCRRPAGGSRSGDLRTVLLVRPAPRRTRCARPVVSRRPARRRGARARQAQQAAHRSGRQQGQGSGAVWAAQRAAWRLPTKPPVRRPARPAPGDAHDPVAPAAARPGAGPAGAGASAHAAPLVRLARPAVLGRPARGAGDARPRQHRLDAGLHPPRFPASGAVYDQAHPRAKRKTE